MTLPHYYDVDTTLRPQSLTFPPRKEGGAAATYRRGAKQDPARAVSNEKKSDEIISALRVALSAQNDTLTSSAAEPTGWLGLVHYYELVSNLVSLWQEPLQNDYGPLRPSAHAVRRTFELISAVKSALQDRFPYSSLSPDSEEGVRITLTGDDPSREVTLVIPAVHDGDEYMYYERGDTYDIEQPVSPENLLDRVRWLLKDE